ncbi:MAG: STAS domain-containing protein [Actinobacteria bacterium]|nr:STAS domain-containing protein [Actinomycetota bacterium]
MVQELYEVELRSIPIAIHAGATEHLEALAREFALILQSERSAESVPRRLRQLGLNLTTQFAGLGDEQNATLRRAVEQNRETLDLTYHVPAAWGEACKVILSTLEEADQYCRQGEHLLTLETPPESLLYRRWVFGEFVRQVAGEPPLPWDDYLDDPSRGYEPVGAPVQTVPRGDAGIPEGWSVDRSGTGSTIRPCGELDVRSSSDLRSALAHARSLRDERVVLDLRDVSFLDSVSIGVIVAAHARLRDDGAELALIAPEKSSRVLQMMGIDQFIEVTVAG